MSLRVVAVLAFALLLAACEVDVALTHAVDAPWPIDAAFVPIDAAVPDAPIDAGLVFDAVSD